MSLHIIATIQPGQNGPKWFVQLFPADDWETKVRKTHGIAPVNFYVSEDNKICDISVHNITMGELEWFQNALEFLKSFSTP